MWMSQYLCPLTLLSGDHALSIDMFFSSFAPIEMLDLVCSLRIVHDRLDVLDFRYGRVVSALHMGRTELGCAYLEQSQTAS